MHDVSKLNGVRNAVDSIKLRLVQEMQEFDPRKTTRDGWRRAALSLSVAAIAVTLGHATGLLDGPDDVNADQAPVDPAQLKIAEAPRLDVALTEAKTPVLDHYAALTQDYMGEVAGLRVERVDIQPGDTLGRVLGRFNVSTDQSAAAISALKAIWDPRHLRVGQEITLYLETSPIRKVSANSADTPDLVGLTLKPSVEKTVAVSKDHEGAFQAREIVMELQREVVKAAGTINNSLYADANNAGATDRVIANFAQIYSYSVDFQREIRQGDDFEIMFERFNDADGNLIKTGEILYASLEVRDNLKELYRFDDGGGSDYYNADGVSTKRFLMKTPINGARLSSHFGQRRHPVLGYTKMHKGTDFAAPRGTPIFAAGDGTIDKAYRSSSYGNFIRIKHSGGWQTAYAHMNRFASGMKTGTRVKQGDVIGYVGTTGRSTGPHLHYEVLKNGAHQNPMGVKVPTGKELEGKPLELFKVERDRLDTLYAESRDASEIKAPLVASASGAE